MVELRNLQLDEEDPKHETVLGPIRDIELIELAAPNPLAEALIGKRSFITCGTVYGYLIDLSLDDMIELGVWWEENKVSILDEEGGEDGLENAENRTVDR